MPESHEDIARVVDRDHGPQQITFRREDTIYGALRISTSAEPAAKRTASLKTRRNLRSLRSEPLATSDGRLMTDSQPISGTQKIGFCHMALKFNFKVT